MRWMFSLLLFGCAASATSHPHPHPHAQEHAHPHAHHADHAHHRFDDVEKWVKVFDDPARDAWQLPDDVISLCKLEPGMTVVDLGAGTGYFMERLSKAVGDAGRVIPLDVEDALVQHMKKRAFEHKLTNAEPRQIPPDDPQLAPGSVDRILIVDTWHHLDDRVAYARKLAAGLEPGGMIIVVDFTAETKMGPPPAARTSPESVMADLDAAGLHAGMIGERLPEQYVVVATK